MNTSKKEVEWLIFFSIVTLMLRYLLFKKSKKFNESYKMQLECHQHILNKIKAC